MLGKVVALEQCRRKPGTLVQVRGQAKMEVEYGHQKNQLPSIVMAESQRPPLFIVVNCLCNIQLALHQLQEKMLHQVQCIASQLVPSSIKRRSR